MSSSDELSKTLERSLSELEAKASSIERLALEVKNNEKRLHDIANSTISYISQLKSQCNSKVISGSALADKLLTQMDKIISSLKADPKKESIDETLTQLQDILQNKRSGAARSGTEGSSAEGSGTEGSGTEGSSAEGSGTEGSSAEGSGREKKGFFKDPLGSITNMLGVGDSGEKDNPGKKANADGNADSKPDGNADSKPDGNADSKPDNEVDLVVYDPMNRKLKGGYRYSSPKKNKKTKKSNLKKTKGRGRKSKRTRTLSQQRRIKSHFTKTRRN